MVLGTFAAGILLHPAPAGAAEEIVVGQPFSADSGDTCLYGSTRGELAWDATLLPTTVSAVAVKAVVVDRPTVDDPGIACPDDRRYTVATFTASGGKTVVDNEAVRVDNGRVEVAFILADPGTKALPIDLVVVQVCRVSPLIVTDPTGALLYDYCGKPQEYRLPIWT